MHAKVRHPDKSEKAREPGAALPRTRRGGRATYSRALDAVCRTDPAATWGDAVAVVGPEAKQRRHKDDRKEIGQVSLLGRI